MPNPYEPPAQPSRIAIHARSNWYRTYVVPLSQVAFWFGAVLFLLGTLISFYPGAEAKWFAVTTSLVACGFFVPNKSYRIAAAVIVAICLFWTYTGYQRGMQYQEWLKTRQQ
jgi:type II secretory pathway component PulF